MLKKPNVLEKRDSRLKNYKYQCRLAAGVTLMLALAASVSQRRPSTHDLKTPQSLPKQAFIRRTFGLLCRKQALCLLQELSGFIRLVVTDCI